LAGAFGFWALVPAMYFIVHDASRATTLADAHAQAAALVRLYGIDVTRALVACPLPILYAGLATFYFLPVLTLALAFDCMNSDSTRLEVVRAPRAVIVMGRWCGQCVAASACIIMGCVIVAIAEACATRDRLSSCLAWAATLALTACLIASAYVAIWLAVGLVARRPGRAFGWCVVVLVALTVGKAVLHRIATGAPPFLPGSLEQLLLLSGTRSVGVVALAAWLVTALGLAQLVFTQRDL
jgi:hypothetical protein